MATVTKTSARFSFTDALGSTVTKTFNEINASVQDAKLQALSSAIVANKEVYSPQPTTAKSIQLISTTTTDVPLA